MPKRVIDLRAERPLLDIVSYARGGRGLTPQQHEQILLTLRRVPEVMVKVSGGARTLAGVERHVEYIGRKGELGLETDLGTQVGGTRFERDLVEDWDLDLEALRRQSERSIRSRKPLKLVHNIIFSMPPGTPPTKVLQAVRTLAVNEWQLRHRYAMALHTDTSHPHVHVVLKAMSEQGERLNIRKATLRSWRSQFAANLRALGVPANATERAVRGQPKTHTPDGLYRLSQRPGWLREDFHDVPSRRPGEERLRRTRSDVVSAWRTLASTARAAGDHGFADRIRMFVGAMSPPMAREDVHAPRAPATAVSSTREAGSGPRDFTL